MRGHYGNNTSVSVGQQGFFVTPAHAAAMASLNASPILGVSARDRAQQPSPRGYQNSAISADARLADICNTITLTIEPTNRPGAVKTSSGYPARRCSVTREDVIELTTRFLAAAQAGLAKGYNALEMNVITYGTSGKRIALAIAYDAVLQAQQRALASRIVPSSWSTNEAKDAMDALSDLANTMDYQGLAYARGPSPPLFPLLPRPQPSAASDVQGHTVGAAPAMLGGGAVGAISLAFIFLGPLLGTATMLAFLRGDPAKRERPKTSRPSPRPRAARPPRLAAPPTPPAAPTAPATDSAATDSED